MTKTELDEAILDLDEADHQELYEEALDYCADQKRFHHASYPVREGMIRQTMRMMMKERLKHESCKRSRD